MEEKTYCVYKHTFPNGRVYIGQTCQKPEERWDNGKGYADNREMFSDIVLFGWRNVAHEIIADGLDREAAAEMERSLILSYGKDGRKKTYNRAIAQYVPAPPKHWLDETITEASIEAYRAKIPFLDDYWMETYKSRMGEYPFSADYKEEGVELTFILNAGKVDGGGFKATAVKQFCPYPKEETTFREAHAWLNTGPEFKTVSEEGFVVQGDSLLGQTISSMDERQ